MKGIFVTGTDTNVGKTWVGTQLLTELKKHIPSIQVRKPIESGWPISIEDISATDAWKLANALDQTSKLNLICPNRFTAAISPDRAAKLEGKIIELQQLQQDCLHETKKSDFLYVEGAGGFYSPICNDALNADLVSALKLPVLLVVEDRLGCINQTLLNIDAINKQGLNLVAIALNKPNQLEAEIMMDNFSDIQTRVECEVVVFQHNQSSTDSIKRLAQLVINI